jgi:hypothetical protein
MRLWIGAKERIGISAGLEKCCGCTSTTTREEQTMSQLPQDPVPLKTMTERLSHRLANFKLSDAVIT